MTARLDVPTRSKEGIKDPSIELWFTEGQTKSDALVTHGLCAVALLGVWNFKGKNEFGGVTLLSDFDEIALNRVINIVFDSDVMTKPPVRAALDRLTEHLQRRGATVNAVYLPGGSDGKVGVDDYLLTHTSDELKALVQQPATAPKAAVPTVELLDGAPAILSRPLALVDGHAYAATWLWTNTTITESLDKKTRNVVRHDPAIVTEERQLVLVRSDGTVYEPSNIESLPIRIGLSDIPQEDKLWRTKGVKDYRAGQRPDYADVFARVVMVYQRFIDFSRSFAGTLKCPNSQVVSAWPPGSWMHLR